MTHEGPGGGPFREMTDPNATALERMRKQIEKENKFSVPLPEEANTGDKLQLFYDALPMVDPKDIVLYSKKTGILNYYEINERLGRNWWHAKDRIYKCYMYAAAEVISRIKETRSPKSEMVFNGPMIELAIIPEKKTALITQLHTIKQANDRL